MYIQTVNNYVSDRKLANNNIIGFYDGAGMQNLETSNEKLLLSATVCQYLIFKNIANLKFHLDVSKTLIR